MLSFTPSPSTALLRTAPDSSLPGTIIVLLGEDTDADLLCINNQYTAQRITSNPNPNPNPKPSAKVEDDEDEDEELLLPGVGGEIDGGEITGLVVGTAIFVLGLLLGLRLGLVIAIGLLVLTTGLNDGI